MIRVGAGGENAIMLVHNRKAAGLYCIREYYLEFNYSCSDRYVTPSA